MPGKLDLTLAPWLPLNAALPQGHGLYRDDPFSLVLNFWTDDTKTVGRDLSGGTWQAQIRSTRLSGATAGEPLAQFDVDATDGDTGVLVISLTRTETRELALTAGSSAFWELQDETGGETLLTGKARIFDDAGRAA